MGDWITVREAAEQTNYTEAYIRELAQTRKIKAKKIVGVWLVDRKSVVAHQTAAQEMGAKRGPKK